MERFTKKSCALYILLLGVMTSSILFMSVQAMDSKGQDLEDHASSQDHVQSDNTQDPQEESCLHLFNIDQIITHIGYKTRDGQNSVARRIHIGSSNYFFHRFGCQLRYNLADTSIQKILLNKTGYNLVLDKACGTPVSYYGKWLFRCKTKSSEGRYVDSDGFVVPVKDSDIQYLATIDTVRHPVRAALGASAALAILTGLPLYGMWRLVKKIRDKIHEIKSDQAEQKSTDDGDKTSDSAQRDNAKNTQQEAAVQQEGQKSEEKEGVSESQPMFSNQTQVQPEVVKNGAQDSVKINSKAWKGLWRE